MSEDMCWRKALNVAAVARTLRKKEILPREAAERLLAELKDGAEIVPDCEVLEKALRQVCFRP